MASASSAPSMKNELASARSPYLLQHKDNPVHWQEWTPATIALAKELDRPIFLSSGYSACHWCHVLAHESFENDEVAQLMNEYFVCVKLDREERPDVDRVYMTYLQATQGGGGWPLSVFLTPNLEPFFAGTYFPRGRFKALLNRIADLWEDDRETCENMGRDVVEQLQDMSSSANRTPTTLAQILSTQPAKKLFAHLRRNHDPRYGGFSPAGPRSTGPKFPSCSMTLEPLARLARQSGDEGDEARRMAVKMLRAIFQGGVRDHVGGGVARYSVDERWRVPHFEKMLYDQAQLVSSSLDFALLSRASTSGPDLGPEERSARQSDAETCEALACDILEYSLRDLLGKEGAFYGAEDADSARERGGKKSEGSFYLWSAQEFDEVIGEDDKEMMRWMYGIKEDGNINPRHDMHGEMTGMNIVYLAHTATEAAARYETSEDDVRARVKEGLERLKKRRDDTRERPGLDDKIVTAWNGLMLSALAKAHTTLPTGHPLHPRCLATAEGVIDFLRHQMWDGPSKTLYRSWREGRGPQAQADDYAYLIRGLLDVYEAGGKEAHLLWAVELQQRQDELFWDDKDGGYFASAPDDAVLVRMKDGQDAAEPSALAVSSHNLLRLSLLRSDAYESYERKAEQNFGCIAKELEKVPQGFGYSVCGLMDYERGYREFVLTGPSSNELVRTVLDAARSVYMPNKVLIRLDPDDPPTRLGELNGTIKALVEGGEVGKAALRMCEKGVCGLPIYDVAEARRVVLGV